MKELYSGDSRPWILAFSGGKDSTAVLHLVWLAMSELPPGLKKKAIDVVYVDTGMEHPAYEAALRSTFKKITKAASEQHMPFRLRIVQPELRHRYFVSVIGRGYAPPTHWFRWCTRSMRIRPMSQFIKSALKKKEEPIILLGLRRAESAARRATLAKYSSKERFLGPYGNQKGATAFTPIEDFRTEEVWQFLMQTGCPWGDNNRNLERLYSLASGGECSATSAGEGMSKSCGGSRFGCWTCTVVRKDRAGEGLAEQDERYDHLLEFRNWLATIRYEKPRRWKIRRNGKPGPGPLTLDTRREVLHRLLETQHKTGFPLLREDELVAIQELWIIDGDRNSTAFAIDALYGRTTALKVIAKESVDG